MCLHKSKLKEEQKKKSTDYLEKRLLFNLIEFGRDDFSVLTVCEFDVLEKALLGAVACELLNRFRGHVHEVEVRRE